LIRRLPARTYRRFVLLVVKNLVPYIWYLNKRILLIRVLTTREYSIERVAFSEDGTRVMDAHIDEGYFHAHVWDVQSGHLVFTTKDWGIESKLAPVTMGRWEMYSDLNETAVRERATRRNIAWFHDPRLFGSTDHPRLPLEPTNPIS
jgi:hypothetical protein